jgi:rhodanese-related sulfurtransferase
MAREITPQELDGLDGYQLVDVRTPEERDAGRIPDDTGHIPFDELHGRAEELGRDTLLVFYCRSGERSRAAADAFEASGFDAATLSGGIVAWHEAGMPVEGEVGHPSGLPPR